ncbi:MAG: TonB-dependent receptor [Planctomycetota bacterium]
MLSKQRKRAFLAALLGTFAIGASAVGPLATGEESTRFRMLEYGEAVYGDGVGEVRPVQLEELLPEESGETLSEQGIQPIDAGPSQPLQGSDAFQLVDTSGIADWDTLGEAELPSIETADTNSASFVEALEEVQGTSEVSLTTAAPVDVVPASAFNLATTPDASETLVNSPTTQTVKARRRSPVAFDPRIRGFYTGQIASSWDGSYQLPVRGDLDSILSKIDPFLIGNVQVISGPYSVRHGSGFSFLNIDTIPTPRYDCCPENHLRLGTNVRTNGGQTYNTATVYGGGSNAGYFANVGYRKGSDYEAGNGLGIPSSYDAFNLFSGIGFDLDENTRSELRYTHLTQDDTEYAGQFFDVDDLVSDGLTHSLIHRDDCTGYSYRIDSWVNYTDFNGDTESDGKRRSDFEVLQRVDAALRGTDPDIGQEFAGTVDGDLLSAGMRAGVTRDIDSDTTFGYGADIRYLRQTITEDFDLSDFSLAGFGTGLPTSELIEPGIYTELSFALKDYWQTAVGARVGWAATQADANDVRAASNFRDIGGNIDEDLDVSDVVSSFFITNDLELSRHYSARFGMGYAERVPSLTQRYSDGLFLAIIQSGFSRVIGSPSLRKERNWQVDARLDADYDNVRTRVSGFHSWIVDYITYAANSITSPEGARLLQAVNTEYATLTGFEWYTEADLTASCQAFASLNYLDGRDREIGQPLPGIFPLESRLGLRVSDSTRANRWGTEWGLRIVDNQDRRGTLRAVDPTLAPIALETATPGFTTAYIRGYLRPTDRVSITGGIENLFDKTYFEHLNLRLPPQSVGEFGDTFVLSPGITPYFGVQVDY